LLSSIWGSGTYREQTRLQFEIVGCPGAILFACGRELISQCHQADLPFLSFLTPPNGPPLMSKSKIFILIKKLYINGSTCR